MSDIKECSHHKGRRHKRLRRCCAGILIFNFILLIIILLIWAILQPKKPQFIIQDATIYAFNVSAPNIITSSIQVTIYSRNPNDKIGVYYDKLDVFATYRSQQITYYTAIPSVYQGHKDVNVWSPFISGVNVPVAPYNGASLSQDQAAGTVALIFKIDGRVRFKVGTYVSGRYHLHVRCPARLDFGGRTTGIIVGSNAVKYQLTQSCSVTV